MKYPKPKHRKSETVAKRIIEHIQNSEKPTDELLEMVTHMIDTSLENRDKTIRHLEHKAKLIAEGKKVGVKLHKEIQYVNVVLTPKRVSGALRNCIQSHGPIDNTWIGSATKRIIQNIYEVVGETK